MPADASGVPSQAPSSPPQQAPQRAPVPVAPVPLAQPAPPAQPVPPPPPAPPAQPVPLAQPAPPAQPVPAPPPARPAPPADAALNAWSGRARVPTAPARVATQTQQAPQYGPIYSPYTTLRRPGRARRFFGALFAMLLCLAVPVVSAYVSYKLASGENPFEWPPNMDLSNIFDLEQ